MGMNLNLSLGLGSTGAAANQFGLAQFDIGASTGTLDITDANLDGATPVFGMMLLSAHRQSQDPQTSGTAELSIGFADGTNEYSASCWAENNQGTANSARKNATAFYNSSAGVGNHYGSLSSFISGGMRISRTDAAPLDYTGFAFMPAGAGWQAAVGNANMGNSAANTIDITSPGFTPDVVIVAKAGDTTVAPTTSATVDGNFELGICVNDGSAAQMCMSWAQDDGNASGAARQGIWTDRILQRLSAFNGNQLWKVTCGTFDASGFSLTTDNAAANQELIWAALKSPTGNVALLNLTTPTSIGNKSYTGAGFQPKMVLVISTNLEAINPAGTVATDADLMAGLGISCFTELTELAASSNMSDDGLSVCTSDLKAVAFQCEDGTDRTASGDPNLKASFVSMDVDGFTLNFLQVDTVAKQLIALCMG